jgi:polar amino acid transport system substrate-binding protein
MVSLGHSVLLCSENTIQIITEEGYPLNYLDPLSNSVEGFSTELVRAVMDDTGLDYEIVIKPWPRAYADATNIKNILLFSVARMEARENDLIWLFKILTVENKVYSLSSNRPHQEISLAELKQSKIAVVQNGMNDNYLKNNDFQELVYVNNLKHSLKLVQRNRLDYFASSIVGIYQHIKKNNLKLSDYKAVLDLEGNNPTLYLATNPNTDENIIKRITSSYKKIYNSGLYHKIMGPLLKEK